jgi:hypothetical protein
MTKLLYWVQIREISAIGLSIVAMWIVGKATSACAHVGAGVGYTAAHMRCVDTSSTLKQSQQCREAVRKQWGQSDGGAADER